MTKRVGAVGNERALSNKSRGPKAKLNISNELKTAMTELEFTYLELAESCKLSLSTISRAGRPEGVSLSSVMTIRTEIEKRRRELKQGPSIALSGIRLETKNKSGVLDLGGLELTELPDELFELKHLTSLNLGDSFFTKFAENDRQRTKHAGRGLHPNQIENSLERLNELPNLKRLSLRFTGLRQINNLPQMNALRELDIAVNAISDLSPLERVPKLTKLDCSANDLSDISPIAHLTDLEVLECSNNNNIISLAPLRKNSKLIDLDCSETSIIDLTPIEDLIGLKRLDCSSSISSYIYSIYEIDLMPLKKLKNLDFFACAWRYIVNYPDGFCDAPSLTKLYLYKSTIRGYHDMPTFTEDGRNNCLNAVREYLKRKPSLG